MSGVSAANEMPFLKRFRVLFHISEEFERLAQCPVKCIAVRMGV